MTKQNGTHTHWRKFHNPDYIGAYAFEPGQEIIATINNVQVEDVMGQNGKKEECMVIRFKDADIKPLICNVTNAKSITKAMGSPYIEDWAGKPIQMYVATINAFGDEMEAVRVRTRIPKLTLPELTPDHPKWSGAVKNLAAKTTTVEAIRKHYTVTDQNASELAQQAATLQEATDASS